MSSCIITASLHCPKKKTLEHINDNEMKNMYWFRLIKKKIPDCSIPTGLTALFIFFLAFLQTVALKQIAVFKF